jgi:hypothetical protein
MQFQVKAPVSEHIVPVAESFNCLQDLEMMIVARDVAFQIQ